MTIFWLIKEKNTEDINDILITSIRRLYIVVKEGETMNRGTIKAKWWQHVLFLGPAVIAFTIVILIPFVCSIYYSMTDWNGISGSVNFVGLDNFKRIFSGRSDFLDSFWFTFKMAVISCILINVVGIFFAEILTSKLRGRNVFRSIFFMPNLIGGLILGFIARFIFVNGFPAIGEAIGSDFFNQQWLGTEETAFLGILIVLIWQSAGYIMVIMIAAFANVDTSLLEAAKIDGANQVQAFFRVKIPQTMPYITVCLFWTLANAFKMFELNLSLTNGGPYGSSKSMALAIYQDAFTSNKYGLATAESLVFLVIVLVIAGAQRWLVGRKEAQYQ